MGHANSAAVEGVQDQDTLLEVNVDGPTEGP
jgi:hypothetical protein